MDLLNWVLDYWYRGSSRKQTYLGLASYGNVKIQTLNGSGEKRDLFQWP